MHKDKFFSSMNKIKKEDWDRIFTPPKKKESQRDEKCTTPKSS